MTPVDTVTLCRLARAAAPQQAFDEYTPEIWYGVLGAYPLDDCKAALMAVIAMKPFVSPSEILTEVKRIRKARVDAFGPLPPPPPDQPDDPRVYAAWKGDMVRRIADGDGAAVKAEYEAIEATFTHHPMPELGRVIHAV
jgi:hypothetical protein